MLFAYIAHARTPKANADKNWSFPILEPFLGLSVLPYRVLRHLLFSFFYFLRCGYRRRWQCFWSGCLVAFSQDRLAPSQFRCFLGSWPDLSMADSSVYETYWFGSSSFISFPRAPFSLSSVRIIPFSFLPRSPTCRGWTR